MTAKRTGANEAMFRSISKEKRWVSKFKRRVSLAVKPKLLVKITDAGKMEEGAYTKLSAEKGRGGK